jgi:oligoendopeptidase F
MPSKNPVNSKGKLYYPITALLPLSTLETTWNLAKHFYTSENDAQIEKDITATEAGYQKFAKKYRTKNFCKNDKALVAALADYVALENLPASKVVYYFAYRHTLNAHDTVAEQKLNLLTDRFTKVENQVVFFVLTIGKISKKQQQEFLKSSILQPYRYLLERIFLEAKHTLTEAEEKIMNLKSTPARSLWVAGTEKILNRHTIQYKGKTIPLQQAIEMVSAVPASERPKLWNVVTSELKGLSDIAENELNAIVIDKKINDELRGYTTAYQAKVQANENELAGVEALVTTIADKGFALSRKFYSLKAKLHGVDSLPYASRYDSIGTETKIPFSDAVEICRDVFYHTKHEYGAFFDNMLQHGHIDVYPKPGRSGGAFMSTDTATPIFVFLNQVDNFKSLETLAHEMGHAIHSYKSKQNQPTWYQGYSLTTAETASTLFENLVFEAVFAQSSDATKITLLHDRLTRDIATIQRQIAFFLFEKEMHELIRTQGAATKEELAAIMTKQLRAHLGKGVNVTDDDGYSFVYVSHFRSMFYVYTYAYGLLMSNLMHSHYKADAGYIDKIDTFLSAGGSATVENIFGSIGINARKLSTFEHGLDKMAEDISTLTKLAKKRK